MNWSWLLIVLKLIGWESHWHEFFGPITEWSKAKPKICRTSFDSIENCCIQNDYETTIDKTIVQSWSTYTWRTGEAIVACSSQGAYLLLSEKKTPKQFCLLWGLPQNKTEQPNIVNLQDKTLPKFSFYMINDDLSEPCGKKWDVTEGLKLFRCLSTTNSSIWKQMHRNLYTWNGHCC